MGVTLTEKAAEYSQHLSSIQFPASTVLVDG